MDTVTSNSLMHWTWILGMSTTEGEGSHGLDKKVLHVCFVWLICYLIFFALTTVADAIGTLSISPLLEWRMGAACVGCTFLWALPWLGGAAWEVMSSHPLGREQ